MTEMKKGSDGRVILDQAIAFLLRNKLHSCYGMWEYTWNL